MEERSQSNNTGANMDNAPSSVLPLGGNNQCFVKTDTCVVSFPWCKQACPGSGCPHTFKTTTSLINHTMGQNAKTRQRPACIDYVLEYGCFHQPIYLDRYVALVTPDEDKSHGYVNRNANHLFENVICPNGKDFDLTTALSTLSQIAANAGEIMTEAYLRYNHLPYWYTRNTRPMKPFHPAAVETDANNQDLDPDTLVDNPSHYFHVRAARLGITMSTALLSMPYWFIEKYFSLIQWAKANNHCEALTYDLFRDLAAKQLGVLQRMQATAQNLPGDINFQETASIAAVPSPAEVDATEPGVLVVAPLAAEVVAGRRQLPLATRRLNAMADSDGDVRRSARAKKPRNNSS
jgi:hypothetical protein